MKYYMQFRRLCIVVFCFLLFYTLFPTHNKIFQQQSVQNSVHKNQCLQKPLNKNYQIKLDLSNETLPNIQLKLKEYPINHGGKSSPANCRGEKVAIIIPYRAREDNLRMFLKNMHPYFIRQQIDYQIFLVEPEKNLTFNRALLFNIGYLESLKINNLWECFVFHDIDLIPENDRILYTCPEINAPRHISTLVDNQNYNFYDIQFGGITVFLNEHIKKINGFSNKFFGWGGEDEDSRARVLASELKIYRQQPHNNSRFHMLVHKKFDNELNAPNPERYKLLGQSVKNQHKDGLNTVKYKIIAIEEDQLYTKIKVSYNQKDFV